MDMSYTDEQDLFRRSVRGFVADRVTPERLAEIADGDEGWDPALWKEAMSLGLTAITVAEEHGGAGLGFVEEAIAAEELGRGVFPGPWLGSVILAQPALEADPALLRAVAGGDRIATLVGLTPYAVDAMAADLFVVATERGLVVAEPDDVEVSPLPTIDGTRRLAEVALKGPPAATLADPEGQKAVLDRTRTRALAALAAEALGVTSGALEMATTYAKERDQFGKKIGQFQAVSHQIADTFMDAELARSLALWAAGAIEAGEAAAGLAAAAAKAYAAEAAVRATERAIQVHGGVGFTWEHPLHRFYKRALWIRAFLGAPSDLFREVSAALLT
jgi:alkylation response protein AidB-like acyl-CoA dehydrogenase